MSSLIFLHSLKRLFDSNKKINATIEENTIDINKLESLNATKKAIKEVNAPPRNTEAFAWFAE